MSKKISTDSFEKCELFKSKPSDCRHFYLLIGNGRLARHLSFWLKHLPEIQLDTWNRQDDPQKVELDRKIQESSRVLLAISDREIESFVVQNRIDRAKVIHFSGSLAFPDILGAHPLMAFSYNLFPLEIYQKIHWTLDKDVLFSQIFPGALNSSGVISAEQKPFYHALCVMGGNFPTLLWQSLLQSFDSCDVSNQALQTYYERVVANFFTHPEKALTGPFVRNDSDTISKNLSALKSTPFYELYSSFHRFYTHSKKAEVL